MEDLNISLDTTDLLYKWGNLNEVVNKRSGRLSYMSMTEYMLMLMKTAFESDNVDSFIDNVAKWFPPSVITLSICSRTRRGLNDIFMIELHLFRGKSLTSSIVAYNENIAIKLIVEFIYKELCSEAFYNSYTVYDIYSRLVFKLKDCNVAIISNALMYNGGYDMAYDYISRYLSLENTLYILFEPILDCSGIKVTPSVILGVLDAIRDSGRLKSFECVKFLDDKVLNSGADVKLISSDNEMILKMSKGYKLSHLMAS